MAQSVNDKSVEKKKLQESIEAVIAECKKDLNQHTSISQEKKDMLNEEIESLENELDKWKENQNQINEDTDGFLLKTIQIKNQSEAGQERELLFLITLLQIDEIWYKKENEISAEIKREKSVENTSKDQKSTKDDETEKCWCKEVIDQIKKSIESWNKNEQMDPITKYMKSQGVIENYEFKLLSINLDNSDDSEFPEIIRKEITILNNNLNEILHSAPPIDKKIAKSIICGCCKCQGSDSTHFCKLKSKRANKFNLSSMICDIVLTRMPDIFIPKKEYDSEEDEINLASGHLKTFTAPEDRLKKGSSKSNNDSHKNKPFIEKPSEITEGDLCIGDQKSEEIQCLELQPITQNALVPDQPVNSCVNCECKGKVDVHLMVLNFSNDEDENDDNREDGHGLD